jgi:hypothetical protein
MAVWINRLAEPLSKSASDEISLLVQYADRLDDLIEAANKQQPALTAGEVVTAISKDLLIKSDDLRKLFNALENLKNLSEEFGGTKKAIDQLSNTLRDDVSSKLKEKNDSIVKAIERYAGDNSVTISYKAQRLTYIRENIYQDAEIITDVRPVFDAKGEKIIEYLITHYLVATYFHNGRFEQIHLAMDAADVVKLRKGCDRAIIKSRAIKAELGDKARILRDDDGNPR